MMPWRDFAARTVFAAGMVGVAVFAGMRLATADPGGPTRDALTFSGVLREQSRLSTTLTFVFHRGTATSPAACTAPTMAFTPDANGAFSVAVPLAVCANPRGLIDGEAVFYDVYLGSTATGTPLVDGVSVTAVPYARFADQVGVHNECPVGYTRMTDAATPPGRWFCRRGIDDVVRVGDGAEVFWIDRYEASVNTGAAADGTWLFTSDDTFGDLPRDGQWGRSTSAPPAFAVSAAGRRPASWITWFQAAEACRASGKRLPSGEEWIAAANGTDDPTAPNNGGSNSRCNTNGLPRVAGGGGTCRSTWGAQDMIGNLWEWTADWHAGAGTGMGRVNDGVQNWPFGNDDATSNVDGFVDRSNGTSVVGLPAAESRGGSYASGVSAGVFSFDLRQGPSAYYVSYGFRCVVTR